jgi:uncharacterized membrane protein
MVQNRLKSPVFWAALAAQVVSILVLLEVINPTQSETVNGIITAVLQAAIAFGLLNNPTSKSTF